MARVLGMDAVKVYQQLLREVEVQFTSRNNNLVWSNHFQSKFQALGSIPLSQTDTELPSSLTGLYRDGRDLLTLLESSRKHKDLLKLYAPVVEEGNRVVASAKRVGLQLPKLFGDVDAKE